MTLLYEEWWEYSDSNRELDSTGKQRNYYPDFYLPEHDLYLDPKNPYAMKQDLEKMTAIASKVNIIYGNKDIIKKSIDQDSWSVY
jgi:hypothetical protein